MLRILFTIARWIIYYHVLYWGFQRFQGKNLLRPFIDADAWRHPVEYAQKYGYDAEQHLITTSDGVILEVHRINSKTNSGRSGIPVILQHGLFASSFGWIANLPHQSLGFILADAGYDVWLANSRGNVFGRTSENQTDFWTFTKEHLALMDLPATIDYILKVSRKTYVHYAGHSQGGFLLMALLSEKPEYAQKIRLGIALAPVLKISNASFFPTNLHRAMEAFSFLPPFPMHSPDRLPANLVFNPLVCGLVPSLCSALLRLHAGGHATQVNISRSAVYAGGFPAGSSFANFRHYTQTMYSDRFAKYDYGKEENMKIYGQSLPPEYDLSKISGKVAVFYSEGDADNYAGSRHNKWLIENIPKRSLVHSEALRNFEHLDYFMGINAREGLYDKMIELMKRFED
ncbi:lysosomal acid lipase/cholesteryl ester hydrolase [Galendromus occidentalis]|uniref:Lipase n=1 Tax=Galendromus occidentalis TaxID=34638 RepID=A0AAJ6QSM3_9ACAR|nr:lysosomal acid lipase/cholesteryl ester hydrolase [Galendromus occidentalis]